MNRKRLFLFLLLFLILFVLSVNYFFFSPRLYNFNTILLSTNVELQFVYKGYKDADTIGKGFIRSIKRLNKVFSSYDRESELSYVNREAYAKDIRLSNELLFVIREGLYYGELSKGAFDISILPLVRLWRAKDKTLYDIPTYSAIKEVQSLVDYRNVLIKGDSIRFLKDGMSLALGGIAKGYIIDSSISYLKKEGIKDALVNIGGDIYALGSTILGEAWRLGIKNPGLKEYSNSYIGVVSLRNKALATSGNYERYRIAKSGKRINHIINPKTGYPSVGILSVSIISNSALISDAIATIVFVLGPFEGLDFINTLDGVEGFIVFDKTLLGAANAQTSTKEANIHFLSSPGFKLKKP